MSRTPFNKHWRTLMLAVLTIPALGYMFTMMNEANDISALIGFGGVVTIAYLWAHFAWTSCGEITQQSKEESEDA